MQRCELVLLQIEVGQSGKVVEYVLMQSVQLIVV